MKVEHHVESSKPVTLRKLQEGVEIFVIRTAGTEVAVVPALGAKVVSLKNCRTGREWMYHRDSSLKLFANKLGDDFAKSTVAGWDECLPTIAPCDWKNRTLPDHGEVWSAPWELDAAEWERGVIKTSVLLSVSPFHFSRTIEIRNNALVVNYCLLNLSASPQEFLWAMHPLLAIQKGDQLVLTEETRKYLRNEPWIDALDFEGQQASCAKAFAGPLQEGSAGVFNTISGDRLSLTWDTSECATLGVWLTRGGWNGHHQLALEPTNGASDELSAAGESKRCGLVSAHGEKRWNVKIQVTP
jgi:galactose mutarotase-like enzyme